MAQDLIEDAQEVGIEDADVLMRWVHKNYVDSRPDGSLKKLKPGAFSLRPDRGLSVFLQRLMSPERCGAKAKSKNVDFIGIVILKAADFREFGLDVRHLPEDGEIAHCESTGHQDKTDEQLTNIKRQWVNRATPTYRTIPSTP